MRLFVSLFLFCGIAASAGAAVEADSRLFLFLEDEYAGPLYEASGGAFDDRRATADAFVVAVSLDMAGPLAAWVQTSFNQGPEARDGKIVVCDLDNRVLGEYRFSAAQAADLRLPALDVQDEGPALLRMQIQPEEIRYVKGSGEVLAAVEATEPLVWNPSLFALHIEGVDCTRVQRLEVVKEKITQLYVSDRFPEIEPTGIEFPSLTISMATAYANDFIKWHEEFVVNDGRDPEGERDGHLEFLDPHGGDSIFTINLRGVGLNIPEQREPREGPADGKEDKKKIELYVDYMELELNAGLE